MQLRYVASELGTGLKRNMSMTFAVIVSIWAWVLAGARTRPASSASAYRSRWAKNPSRGSSEKTFW